MLKLPSYYDGVIFQCYSILFCSVCKEFASQLVWFGLYVHLLIFKFRFQIFVHMIGNWQILPKGRNSVLQNRTFIRFWILCSNTVETTAPCPLEVVTYLVQFLENLRVWDQNFISSDLSSWESTCSHAQDLNNKRLINEPSSIV